MNLTRTAVDDAVDVVNAHTTDMGRHDGHYCLCGAGPFRSYNGQRKHETARRRAAFASLPMGTTPEHVLAIAARVAEVEAIADAAEPAEETVEQDVPPTDEERVTVRIRTRELRPGDVIVDAAGREVYAAFDVQVDSDGGAKVWTAIRNQEAGMPPVVHLHRDREVLVLRPVSEEGRELLAALDRVQA